MAEAKGPAKITTGSPLLTRFSNNTVSKVLKKRVPVYKKTKQLRSLLAIQLPRELFL